MKFFVSSDWHADWATAGIPRYQDVADAVYESAQAAIDQKADAYLFAGDLCDPEDGPAALAAVGLAMAVAVKLEAAGVPSYWIAGNHDVIEDGSGRTTLSPMRALERHYGKVRLFETFAVKIMETFNLVTLPFAARSHTYDQADCITFAARCHTYDPAERITTNVQIDLKAPTVVLAHLSVPGVQPGEETAEMPRGRDVVLPLDALLELKAKLKGPLIIINGHYHRQQHFRAANGLVVHIPGSLARLTHSEEQNNPGYLVVEV